MKRMTAILLILAPLLATARSLDHAAKSDLAGSGMRDIRITASIPNTSTLELVRATYPPDVHVGGTVVVRVNINEAGNVISARGLSGHPILKPLVLEAARKSRFKRDSAQGRKFIMGTITYTFSSADISYNELASLVGKPVTLRGKFSSYGKLGAVVMVDDQIVYIRSKPSFVWGRRYELMENKIVTVTGTLRFYKSPPQPDFVRGVAVPKTPDHFYFEAERSSIQLDGQ
jgi:hypothetical protein